MKQAGDIAGALVRTPGRAPERKGGQGGQPEAPAWVDRIVAIVVAGQPQAWAVPTQAVLRRLLATEPGLDGAIAAEGARLHLAEDLWPTPARVLRCMRRARDGARGHPDEGAPEGQRRYALPPPPSPELDRRRELGRQCLAFLARGEEGPLLSEALLAELRAAAGEGGEEG